MSAEAYYKQDSKYDRPPAGPPPDNKGASYRPPAGPPTAPPAGPPTSHGYQSQYYQQGGYQQPQYQQGGYSQQQGYPQQQPIYVQQQAPQRGNDDCMTACLAALCICCTLDILF